MIYHSILFSFCLIGMVSAGITSCVNKDNKLEVTCKPSKADQTLPCTLTSENKETKEKITNKNEECKLELAANKEKDVFNITCSVGSKTETFVENVEMKKMAVCSAGSVLQYAGVSLLLALLAPLLSQVL